MIQLANSSNSSRRAIRPQGRMSYNTGRGMCAWTIEAGLWMTRRGVLVYDGQAWHPFYTRLPDSHFSDTRRRTKTARGNIWVGLWGGGLVFCDPVSVQLYTEADGLPDREVRCVGEDREGRLWIGTMGGLACREDDQIRSVAPRRTVSTLCGRSTGAGLERRGPQDRYSRRWVERPKRLR